MKSRSIIIASGAIVIALIATVFYSANPNSTHENRIRVAFLANVGHAIPIIGSEKGFFQDALGDQVKIETSVFDSGPQIIESMFSKSVDLAYVGPGPALNGFLKTNGQGIKILSGAASGGTSLVIHPMSGIKSVNDFPGKRIASPQIGNSQDVSLRSYLEQNGLKPVEKGGSVYVINIQNPDIYTLFSKGDIDGAWVPEPWASRLVLELNGTRLFHEEELWPDGKFSSAVLIGRDDYVKSHPEIVTQWITTNEKTADWINKNPDDTKMIFNQFLKKTLGKSLRENILNESFSNIQITSDPLKESIFTFAENSNHLGYLGRHGYNLDGLFYDTNDKLELKEVQIPNGKT